MFRRFRYINRVNCYLITVVISLLIIYAVSVVNMQIKPLMLRIAETQGRSIAVSVINETVNLVMDSDEYNELVVLEKGQNGQITAVSADTIKMNKLKADLSTQIQLRMQELSSVKIGIPVGNLLDNEFLSGRGPNIHIKLVPVGYAQIDVSNRFESAGINQTLHQIVLDVSAGISILLPIYSHAVMVNTSLPIAQTVIVGEVPGSFTSVNGASGNAADNALLAE